MKVVGGVVWHGVWGGGTGRISDPCARDGRNLIDHHTHTHTRHTTHIARTQTSMAVVYSGQESMISGARYHRVTTYSVRSLFSCSPGRVTPRERPKSQIYVWVVVMDGWMDVGVGCAWWGEGGKGKRRGLARLKFCTYRVSVNPSNQPIGLVLPADRNKYLEVAVGVEEDVGGLQVPVDDLGRVHVLQRAQHLLVWRMRGKRR